MLIDSLNEFSDKQVVLVSAPGSKVIDQVNPGNAKLNELYLHVIANEAAEAVGAAKVQVNLKTSATAANDVLTGDIKTLAISAAIPKADIVAGATIFKIRQPEGTLRYIGIDYVVGSGPLTAGAFSAFLNADA